MLTADVIADYHCFAQDDIQTMLHHQSKKEQMDELKKSFDIATYDIVSFDYEELPSAKPVIVEKLQHESQQLRNHFRQTIIYPAKYTYKTKL